MAMKPLSANGQILQIQTLAGQNNRQETLKFAAAILNLRLTFLHATLNETVKAYPYAHISPPPFNSIIRIKFL